jgi:osmotically-inducible protein OsmY
MHRMSAILIALTAGLLAGCMPYLPSWTTPAQLAGEGAVIAAEERQVGEVAEDFAMKAAILQEFALKAQSLLLWVRADVYQSDVMLTGAVKEEEDEKRAGELAKGVEGVRKVYNDIQITEDGTLHDMARDYTTEYKVQLALLGRVNHRVINYRWRCVNGILYLFGMAKDEEELEEALDAIYGVDGVEDVVEHVRMKDKIKLPDFLSKPG